jgi:hypothetical protein
MAQCPGPDGIREHHGPGRGVPRGERYSGGDRPCQNKGDTLSCKIIPFKIKGEVTALHSFSIKKPHSKMGNGPSSEAFLISDNERREVDESDNDDKVRFKINLLESPPSNTGKMP